MPPTSDEPISPLSWQRELYLRLVYLWPLKAVGTSAFMVLFFWAYFSILRNPSREPWVMPEIWIDHWVPFTPWAFPVYASLWVYVSLAPALIGNLRGLLRFGLWVSLLCLVCLVIFWVFPTQVPDFPIDWSQHPSLSFLKGVDASGNACPSLHVASAVFAAYWMHHLLTAMRAPGDESGPATSSAWRLRGPPWPPCSTWPWMRWRAPWRDGSLRCCPCVQPM